MNLKIRPAATIDAEALARFLKRSFAPPKASFLLEHGAWQHRGEEHQMVLADGERLIGYCGVIPVRCRIERTVHEAVWWVDLVIDPQHRGRGMQRLFDERVRKMTQLKLGFPNALAAEIHRRHGWGVRDDFETLLLPLRPSKLRSIRGSTGARRLALRTSALLLEPAAASLRRKLARHTGVTEKLERIDPQEMANLFDRAHSGQMVTTERDPAHLEWRYANSPYRESTRIYSVEGRLAAVARFFDRADTRVVRILDLFGALDRDDLLFDLLRTLGGEAARFGAAQVTLFSSLPALGRIARRAGFQVPSPGRFCWYSSDHLVHQAIGALPNHWVLADSDHDEPS